MRNNNSNQLVNVTITREALLAIYNGEAQAPEGWELVSGWGCDAPCGEEVTSAGVESDERGRDVHCYIWLEQINYCNCSYCGKTAPYSQADHMGPWSFCDNKCQAEFFCNGARPMGLTATGWNNVLSAEDFEKKAAEALKDTDGDLCKTCNTMASNLVCLVDGQCYGCYLYSQIDPNRFQAIDRDGDWNYCSCCNVRISPLKDVCRSCAFGETKPNWEYTPIMNNKPKVSGNATKDSSLVTIAAFVVPVSLGVIVAAAIYNQYYGTMQSAEAIAAAKYWIKFGALASIVLGTISAAIEFAIKGVK